VENNKAQDAPANLKCRIKDKKGVGSSPKKSDGGTGSVSKRSEMTFPGVNWLGMVKRIRKDSERLHRGPLLGKKKTVCGMELQTTQVFCLTARGGRGGG